MRNSSAGRRSWPVAVVLAAALLGPAAPVAGQAGRGALRVVGEHALTFRPAVVGGVLVVRPADAGAGRWRVEGPARQRVRLRFRLPRQLVSGPWTLVLRFGADAAAFATTQAQERAIPFDPRAELVVRLPDAPAGRPASLFVWLGARALVAPRQAAAVYRERAVLEAVPVSD